MIVNLPRVLGSGPLKLRRRGSGESAARVNKGGHSNLGWTLVLLSMLVCFIPATWADEQETTSGKLESVFDAKRGLLRLSAVDVSRIAVLQGIADAAGIEFRLLGAPDDELVTLELDDVPLKAALAKVLENQSYVMHHPSQNVVSVWLLTSSEHNRLTIRPSRERADGSPLMSDAEAAELADLMIGAGVFDINRIIEEALTAAELAAASSSPDSDPEQFEAQLQREALLLELLQEDEQLLELLRGNAQLAELLREDAQLLEQLMGGVPASGAQGSEVLQTEGGVEGADAASSDPDIVELMELLKREEPVDGK